MSWRHNPRTSIHALLGILGILGPAGPGLMLPYWGFAHCEGIVSGVAWMWGSSGAFEPTIFLFFLNMVGTPNDFYCETWEVSYFLDLHRYGWNPIVAEEHDLTTICNWCVLNTSVIFFEEAMGIEQTGSIRPQTTHWWTANTRLSQ